MNVSLALEYLPRRMKELEYVDYSMRLVHLLLQPSEVRIIEASCEIFILVGAPQNITIDSDMGIFDLGNTVTNELQHEHQGLITVSNYGTAITGVEFIQVIPKTIKKQEHGTGIKQ